MIDPATRIRDGLDPSRAVEVITKAGAKLAVMPCLITPRDILTGRISPYQAAVMALRNAWARADLTGASASTIPADLWGAVALGAIRASYDITRDELNDMLADEGEEVTMVAIAAAACGRTGPLVSDQRRRALNAAMVGLADVPLTPNELAMVSDFAVNSSQAPG